MCCIYRGQRRIQQHNVVSTVIKLMQTKRFYSLFVIHIPSQALSYFIKLLKVKCYDSVLK